MLVRRKKARDDVPTLTDVVEGGRRLAVKPDHLKTSRARRSTATPAAIQPLE
jgi:hypothetical protein